MSDTPRSPGTPRSPVASSAGPAAPETGDGRVLHVVFVVDGSGSMTGERIASLNYAIRTAIPAMQEAASDHPDVQVLVRVLRFADGADWVIANPVPISRMTWTNLTAGGETNMGAALRALAAALAAEPDPEHALPPVILLVSDGLATDDAPAGLDALLATDLGGRAVRIPVAIGQDADLELLQSFIADASMLPLRANTCEMLVSRIRWASSVPVEAVSATAAGLSPGEAAEAAKAETAGKGADDLLW